MQNRLFQWIFQVPLKGGRWHITPQLAVYTTYIPLIYCLLMGYIIPTILYRNLKNPLIIQPASSADRQHRTLIFSKVYSKCCEVPKFLPKQVRSLRNHDRVDGFFRRLHQDGDTKHLTEYRDVFTNRWQRLSGLSPEMKLGKTMMFDFVETLFFLLRLFQVETAQKDNRSFFV